MTDYDLTVVVPAYNESAFLPTVVSRVVEALDASAYRYAVLVVDDASSDWTDELERELVRHAAVDVLHLPRNRGKGGVLGEVFPSLAGPWTVIIDADNEYDPHDIPRVVEPLSAGHADWVFGTRYGFGRRRPPQYVLTYAVNRLFNVVFRLLSGVPVTDVLTGLYAFRSELVRDVRLREARFAYTPELLWTVLRRARPRWQDVPVAYHFRTYREGKTIRWWETFTILFAMVRYKYARLPPDDDPREG